ncbi:hypothetical protein COY25_00130 [Candidatus Uhrbacteria bacterium CG_4_10_14_0_2_um_filter_41_7]|uniref:Uncharacterized protein n=1 Tax=Candidatus Uhrbacteria bacterium CG_4_9_14_3_um_filter_41_35 TaxID=1975034 RepID=A0A2M7XHC6_9BACT|nr:MAG: hypothetical protein COV92_02740 [Candidatus Uhrbacteria bacterium CG11_big_fil_rev_8_21_14_0_20_41_9]PIZ55846.1 MAG: hypothetical protein COY25_00130 [Candidatus Uhrbacteria bacterium CG_4_10_14_0_2_um_filter_41_7]PJA47116.1 MAG: hypothetical protein CO173_00020 [Candidatus Uhrbacteria bacterium CG_4_9_14_3_um_filter_41_35]
MLSFIRQLRASFGDNITTYTVATVSIPIDMFAAVLYHHISFKYNLQAILTIFSSSFEAGLFVGTLLDKIVIIKYISTPGWIFT